GRAQVLAGVPVLVSAGLVVRGHRGAIGRLRGQVREAGVLGVVRGRAVALGRLVGSVALLREAAVGGRTQVVDVGVADLAITGVVRLGLVVHRRVAGLRRAVPV